MNPGYIAWTARVEGLLKETIHYATEARVYAAQGDYAKAEHCVERATRAAATLDQTPLRGWRPVGSFPGAGALQVGVAYGRDGAVVCRALNPGTGLIEWAAVTDSGPAFTGQDLHDAVELAQEGT